MQLSESVRLNRRGIQQLQANAYAGGDLLIWVIYEHPSDFPAEYVVRPFSSKRGAPLALHFNHAQLEYVRGAMRNMGLTRLPRSPGDDPCILESWV